MIFEKNIYEDQLFEKTDSSGLNIDSTEFEECIFKLCDFSKIKITSCKFIQCTFIDCDLSMADLTETQLSDVKFKNCKLMGIHFFRCNKFLFDVGFDTCILDYSSFAEMKIPKTSFSNSNLKGVDFNRTFLEQAHFDGADLNEAIFSGTNLKGADFSTARNYIIDPRDNFLKNAKFSRNGLWGLLTNIGIKIID